MITSEDCNLNVHHTVWLSSAARFVYCKKDKGKKTFTCRRPSRNVRASGANPAVIQKSPRSIKIAHSLGRTKRAHQPLRANRVPAPLGEDLQEPRC